VGAVVADDLLDAVIADVLDAAGVDGALADPVDGVEAVRRGDALFLLNRGHDDATIPLPGAWIDLLTNDEIDDRVTIPRGDARVVTERRRT